MASGIVPVICKYDGILHIQEGQKPHYEGGESKVLKVHISSSYDEFKDLIYRRTKISRAEYDLNLVFMCPYENNEWGCVKISDTEDLSGVLEFYPNMKSIIIMIVKEPLQTYLPQPLDDDNNPTAEESPVRHIPSEGTSYVPATYEEDNVARNDPSSSRIVDDSVEDFVHDDILVRNSMVWAIQDDNNDNWVGEAYANNEDVENVDIHPTEDIDDDMSRRFVAEDIDATQVTGELDGFFIGQKFTSKDELVQRLTEWSVPRSVAFSTVRSNQKEFTAVCATHSGASEAATCAWRIHASIEGKFFHSKQLTIKSLIMEHTCRNIGAALETKQLTSKFICRRILAAMKERLDLTPLQIQDIIKVAYSRDISYKKAWDARRKAVSILFGDWEESYKGLNQYLAMLKWSNPGTEYILCVNACGGGISTFESVFWTFGPSVEGFRHCRPVLSIDGTHLYGKYSGALLIATGVDADGGLFPLAFAIVEVENQANWMWFFSCIGYHIPSARDREITWISDRMKGIPSALQEGWKIPHHHRFCLRHIKENFKRNFQDKALINMFYRAGRTPEITKYTKLRRRLKELSPAADAWIEKSLGAQNEERWTQCKDGGKRFGIMTTNASESFNGVLKGARGLPIQSLIARTFYRINKFFVKRREMSARWTTPYTPKNERIFKSRNEESRGFRITRFTIESWEVIDNNGKMNQVHIVDGECKCSCEISQLQKIPCAHVISVTSRAAGGANIDSETLCSDWYTVAKYQQAYEPFFRPVPDKRFWPPPPTDQPIVVPPPDKRKKGRPPSTRFKNEMDTPDGESQKTRCTICKQIGHNKRRCPKNQPS